MFSSFAHSALPALSEVKQMFTVLGALLIYIHSFDSSEKPKNFEFNP